MNDSTTFARLHLDQLLQEGRLRSPLQLAPRSAVNAERDGSDVLLFSTNDYLGLSHSPEVREATALAAAARGLGLRGSALVCGYSDEHAALEAELGELKGTETALLFPTGYQANLSVVSALGGPDATIFSDQLCHASLIDGCRLARCQVEIYAHRDASDLDRRLAACRTPRRVIVTDSVFSMEGTHAPLRDLVEVKRRHGALLVVDEAHATLVYGDGGGGLTEAQGVAADIDLHVGTLSKAVGCQGGFVATSEHLRQWLLNVARPYIFTTALPLPVVAAARAALKTDHGALRHDLWRPVLARGRGMERLLDGPIVPIPGGDDRMAVAASQRLLAQGLHVPAIRPPAVPAGTARLRVSLSAAHTKEDVKTLLAALRENGLV